MPIAQDKQVYEYVGSYRQDPAAIKSYLLDWTRFLPGETLVSSSWSADDDLLLSSDTYDPQGSASVRVAVQADETKVVGRLYEIRNHVTTASGIEDTKTIAIGFRYE